MDYQSRLACFEYILSPPKHGVQKPKCYDKLEELCQSELRKGKENEDLVYVNENNNINIDHLRFLCQIGVPENQGIRATCWKVLLGYLPKDKNEWLEHLALQRQSYYEFVKELTKNPSRTNKKEEYIYNKEEKLDHPLNLKQDSKWHHFVKDKHLLEQIDLDVRRTLAEVDFFQREIPKSPILEKENLIDSDTKSILPWNSIPIEERRGLFSILDRRKDNINLKGGINSSTSSSGKLNPLEVEFSVHSKNKSIKSSKRNSLDIYNEKSKVNFIKRSLSLSLSKEASDEALELKDKEVCNKFNPSLEIKINSDSLSSINYGCEAKDFNWEAMERILFVYAKLNPGLGYIQGMNELLGPLYYICANDNDIMISGKSHAEADTFYLFTALMGLVQDQFNKQLDLDLHHGIQAVMTKFNNRLEKASKKLYLHLKNNKVDPTYYAFRWINVLGTHEFSLPDVIRLWDVLFSYCPNYSSPNPSETMLIISIAMVKLLENELIFKEFSENLILLQHFPTHLEINTILDLAFELNKDFLLQDQLNNNNEDKKRSSSLLNISIMSSYMQFKPENLRSALKIPSLKPGNNSVVKERENIISTSEIKRNIRESLSFAKRFIANTHKSEPNI